MIDFRPLGRRSGTARVHLVFYNSFIWKRVNVLLNSVVNVPAIHFTAWYLNHYNHEPNLTGIETVCDH